MNNYLLIISDEHNPFYSSTYGNSIVSTPNMQRIANEGTLFQNAYCPSPLCMPSRSSFMSGKPVHKHQVYNNCNAGLKENQTTYGEVLKNNGVHTTHIGKTHVYNRGVNLGFSEMILPGDEPWPGDENVGRKNLIIREDSAERAKGYGPKENPYERDQTWVDAAKDWLDNSAKDINSPWVLALNLLVPHFPHFTTKELWEKYKGAATLPAVGSESASARHKQADQLRQFFNTDSFSEKDTLGLIQGYYACIDYLDQQIGILIDTLEKNGLLENTNVIYTSDHGEMLGKFGMWWKCSLYEDSSRIPCMAFGPDFESNKVVQTPVTLHDVRASLFETNNLNQPEEWMGEPLQKISENDAERIAFCEYHGHGTSFSSYMIRKADWKLIYHIDGGHQLFNIEKDPDELTNLFGQNKKKENELMEELRNICDPEKESKIATEFTEKQIEAFKNVN